MEFPLNFPVVVGSEGRLLEVDPCGRMAGFGVGISEGRKAVAVGELAE